MIAAIDVFQALPIEYAPLIRWFSLIAGITAMLLMLALFWAFRGYVRGYGLFILTGILCYQAATIYGNAFALSQDEVPLSSATVLITIGHLIFIGVGLEPARTKRVRISRGNTNIDRWQRPTD
jgi:peptidoglycan/LPS O-acetylase OafA/YrhL